MQSIEERVTRLEDIVFGSVNRDARKNDWQESVGTVTDDAISKTIIDGVLLLREEERQRARQENGHDTP